jgi:hypothetical protein
LAVLGGSLAVRWWFLRAAMIQLTTPGLFRSFLGGSPRLPRGSPSLRISFAEVAPRCGGKHFLNIIIKGFPPQRGAASESNTWAKHSFINQLHDMCNLLFWLPWFMF